MSLSRTLLLGAIAGGTILLGLPLGRMRNPAPGLRVFLNATAIGILVFLLWDVLAAAWEPIDTALADLHEGSGTLAPAAGFGALFAVGLAAGLLSLVAYEGWMRRRATAVAGRRFGPGAMAVGELDARSGVAAWSPARRLALLIAVGIGLHNFAEGLAIGQSAASGQVALATLLVIGFGLHNATEGFGITAPLVGQGERPTWRFLFLLGIVGGGPTFLGTMIGQAYVNERLYLLFLSLAVGSILYVIVQLFAVAQRLKRPLLLHTGLLVGLFAGIATDYVVVAAGA